MHLEVQLTVRNGTITMQEVTELMQGKPIISAYTGMASAVAVAKTVPGFSAMLAITTVPAKLPTNYSCLMHALPTNNNKNTKSGANKLRAQPKMSVQSQV
jgi:hypothetical protein